MDVLRATSTIAQALDAGYPQRASRGAFALDDAYCAGWIVQKLEGAMRSDSAIAAEHVARAHPTPRFSPMVGAAAGIVRGWRVHSVFHRRGF